MATTMYTTTTAAPSYTPYSQSKAALFFQDPSFLPMTVTARSGKRYPLSKIYVKYIRRVWKRVSRATRKPERASILPDGFVLINNARLSAAAKRKSVLFG
ncbi:uncharacterized protein FOMMEDRAFT_141932 [Fomitiporia mediterranea MF3/22]|uniref:uncharacterized protein n=1 Tax=Fomitiporia mediterranea (strain MF3/22) TaxID=694068 RepID=UPI0004409874|nr:uncharacterized protein FOMMEDRAFT_141932 [Fomitiporia mediterranea MF3/22]EJD01258.1 hypothetical protein FOMMEDRAFT_141932 [Fomitiporia mediterranea MF3/22]